MNVLSVKVLLILSHADQLFQIGAKTSDHVMDIRRANHS